MRDTKKVTPLVEELTGIIPQQDETAHLLSTGANKKRLLEDIEVFIDGIENPAEPNQALKDAAERLKGKELFKESNDRARKILSEIKSLPIQETLEEVAERLAYDSTEENKGFPSMKRFIQGAKWQQERSYSEEEVIAFGEFIFKHSLLAHSKGVKNLFEQFKNK